MQVQPGLCQRVPNTHFPVQDMLLESTATGTKQLTTLPVSDMSAPLSLAVKFFNIYQAVVVTHLPHFSGLGFLYQVASICQPGVIYLSAYNDAIICHFLEFGWPLNYTGASPPATKHKAPALAFPAHVTEYITTEVALEALIRPFPQVPFTP